MCASDPPSRCLQVIKGGAQKIDDFKSPRIRCFGVSFPFIVPAKTPYEAIALKSTRKGSKYSATRPKGAGLKIDFCKSPRLRDFGVLIGFIEGGKGPYEVTALKSTQKWKKYSATRPIFL